MATKSLSTVGATAAILAALGSGAFPETTSSLGGSTTFRHANRTVTSLPNSARKRAGESSVSDIELVSATNEGYFHDIAASRQTSPVEKLVGEIRRWSLLSTDWDGEGGCAPILSSVRQTEAFVRLLNNAIPLPEPMLHANGRTGLYWNDGQLYADLEFLGDGRMAYFIERNEDKHKGVLKFDPSQMPSVFSTLLRA